MLPIPVSRLHLKTTATLASQVVAVSKGLAGKVERWQQVPCDLFLLYSPCPQLNWSTGNLHLFRGQPCILTSHHAAGWGPAEAGFGACVSVHTRHTLSFPPQASWLRSAWENKCHCQRRTGQGWRVPDLGAGGSEEMNISTWSFMLLQTNKHTYKTRKSGIQLFVTWHFLQQGAQDDCSEETWVNKGNKLTRLNEECLLIIGIFCWQLFLRAH